MTQPTNPIDMSSVIRFLLNAGQSVTQVAQMLGIGVPQVEAVAAAPAPAPAEAAAPAPAATPAAAAGSQNLVGGTPTETAPAAPTTGAAAGAVNGPEPITASSVQALTQWDQAYTQAEQSLDAANTELQSAAQALASVQAQGAQGYIQLQPANDRYQRAITVYNNAVDGANTIAAKRAQAYQDAIKSDDPTTRATAQANLETAQANAAQAKANLDEWNATAADRKAVAAATIRTSNATATLSEAQAAVASATGPIQVQQAQVNLAQAKVNVDASQQALDVATQLGPLQVKQASATVSATEAGTSLTQAQTAAVLLDLHQKGLITDEQYTRAIDLNLQQQEAGIAGTQAATANTAATTAHTNALLPGEIAQQGATLAQTQAQTNQLTQGTLAGLDEYFSTLKDAIAKGLITPDQATQMLTARLQGTDVFTGASQAEQAQENRYNAGITQRGQDIGLAGNRLSAFTSLSNQGLGTLAGLNTYAQPGSNAGAQAIGGYVQAMLGALGGPQAFQAPPPIQAPPLPPALQSYLTPGPRPAAPAAPAAGAVTINIGAPQQGSSYNPNDIQWNQPANPANVPGRTNVAPAAPQPALVTNKMPATPQDVYEANRATAAKFGIPWSAFGQGGV
jgi:hypothetical protein